MLGMYGARFADAWRDTDPVKVKALWGDELGRLTRDELRRGVEAMRREEWPPTLPKFVALCRPPVNVDAALYEAVEQMRKRQTGNDTWSDPALFWAAVKVGEFDMLNLAHSQLKTRFAAALEALQRDDSIAPVPPRTQALPSPGKSKTSAAEARAILSKIGAGAIVKTDAGNDGRAWAKRIMERAAASDPTLNMVQVQFAREAIGADCIKTMETRD